MACATLWWHRQCIEPISHQLLFYCARAMYWHLFLDQYLYSLNIHGSNKTLQVKYIVIAQYHNNLLTTPPESSTCAEEHLNWSCKSHVLCQAQGYGRGREPSYVITWLPWLPWQPPGAMVSAWRGLCEMPTGNAVEHMWFKGRMAACSIWGFNALGMCEVICVEASSR